MSSIDFSDPEMQEIYEGFVVETTELLDNLNSDLMVLEERADDIELLNQIFRSCHTIKGTSAFMGFERITEITHHGEDLLNKLRKGELEVSQAIIDVMLEVHDCIEDLMDEIREGEDSTVDFTELIAEIEVLKSPGQNPEAGSADEDVKPTAVTDGKEKEEIRGALDRVLSNKDLIDKPGDFTTDELDLLSAAFEEGAKDFFADIDKKPPTETDSNSKSPESETVKEPAETKPKKDEPAQKAAPAPKPPKAAKPKDKKPKKINQRKPGADKSVGTETIRVDVGRVEALLDLSGELVLGRNRLAQITDDLDIAVEQKELVRELIETTSQIDLVTSDIQSAVMRMRMVPVAKLYQKAPRIVRDLSKEFGKKIKLVVKGEETEIDRGIIEELNDPLVHMIRNSCDHGVESIEKRLASGKSQEGTVVLDAEQEGNAIVLKITDDGAGMDPEKLKIKALEKGVITDEQAMQMTDREVYQLIFAPGFSTAAKVTAVSGRGVGMDVVRTNISKLKGMIDIESELGKGSTFIIKLPLTLAIIQGLLIRLQGETYAIPLNSVVEVVAIEPESINTVNQQEVIRIRQNDVWPLIRMDQELGVNDPVDDLKGRYVVVVGLGVHRVGLVVDELLGQQEIVIKSIGEYLGQVKGVAGSTILGDGRVIMIIDIAELVNENKSGPGNYM